MPVITDGRTECVELLGKFKNFSHKLNKAVKKLMRALFLCNLLGIFLMYHPDLKLLGKAARLNGCCKWENGKIFHVWYVMGLIGVFSLYSTIVYRLCVYSSTLLLWHKCTWKSIFIFGSKWTIKVLPDEPHFSLLPSFWSLVVLCFCKCCLWETYKFPKGTKTKNKPCFCFGWRKLFWTIMSCCFVPQQSKKFAYIVLIKL